MTRANLVTPRRQRPNEKETRAKIETSRGYRDLEQEVKEAEPGTSKESTTKEGDRCKKRRQWSRSQTWKKLQRKQHQQHHQHPRQQQIDNPSQRLMRQHLKGRLHRKRKKRQKRMKKFGPSFKKRRLSRSTKKSESVEISKRDQKIYQGKQKDEKTRERIQKILEKVRGTRNIPSIKSVKKRNLVPKVKTKKVKPSRRDRESLTFLRNSMKICTKAKKITLEEAWSCALKRTKKSKNKKIP